MSGFLKFIAPLVHPLGFAWLLLLAATAFCVFRRQRLAAASLGLAAFLLWFLCQPWLAVILIGRLERPWILSTIETAPHADAVVVLGGGWRTSRSDFASLDLTACGDRLIAGFELCRRGNATNLVVGGDPLEQAPGMKPSSQKVRSWFYEWKLSPATFHTLGPVRSTREEALRTRELCDRLGWTNVLLVTSAMHMRRSVATFEKAGVHVHPVACDFQVLRFPVNGVVVKWFPDEDALATFALGWHEQLGWLAYRAFGHL